MIDFIKIFPVLALGGLLASCNKSPMEGNVPQAGEICFGSRGISVETRAVTETTGDALQNEGFVCATVMDADNSVMFNTALSYDDGVYRVPGKKYFYPAEGTVSFYAVYPCSEQISVSADGAATLDYSQNDSEDLVIASSQHHGSSDDAVTLSFSHALAQLLVKCRGNDPETDFLMKEISVTAPAGGVYNFAEDSWNSPAEAQDYSYVPAEGESVTQDYSKNMTFIPGQVQVHFAWDCLIKGTQTVVGHYEQNVAMKLVKGRRSTMNVTLCNSEADELRFTASVDAWEGDEIEVDMEEFRVLETIKQEAVAQIDAAVGSNTSSKVLEEAALAKTAINAASSAAEVEKRLNYGLKDIRYAKGSPTSTYLGTEDTLTGEKIADTWHRTTANCYVIRDRGYFYIKMVYGNGVVNGQNNTAAYTGAAFMDHEGNPITSPYIMDHLHIMENELEAKLLWESETGLIKTAGVSNGEVMVTIDRKDAKGNAVVALVKKNDTDTILWSWHLWVIGRDGELGLEDYNGTQMLDLDLGAMDARQEGHLFYQWGRKDPFQATPKRTMAGGGKPGVLGIRDAIGNPDAFFTTGETMLWFNDEYISSNEYCSKMWNSVKTIYDPCPAGFCVPKTDCFQDFSSRIPSSQYGKTVMMAKDDNGKNAQFRADGYIAGSGEFRAQSPATSIYWTNVPDVSTGDGHGKGLGLTLSQGGSAAISSNNASIGGAIRPMKSNN